jgi:hypothetical protein
MAQKDDN